MLINGEKRTFDNDLSVLSLLEKLALVSDSVVVELNGNIVMKKDFSTQMVFDSDVVEIVSFVGGG